MSSDENREHLDYLGSMMTNYNSDYMVSGMMADIEGKPTTNTSNGSELLAMFDSG